MPAVLVFGLSGQVGAALRPRLHELPGPVLAVSRARHADAPGLRWVQAGLPGFEYPVDEDIRAIVSLGPLDHFADWYAGARTGTVRVLALGSTGVRDKRDSPEPAERELAQRLAHAEATLFAAAGARGAAATILRPTLLYGGTLDRSLSPVLARARAWGLLPAPWPARGLRQPVHVADVAAAVIACLPVAATAGQAYDLPGAEALRFDAMLRRALATQAPGAWLLPLPAPLFRVLAAFGRRRGWPVPGPGALARLGQDQAADPEPARRAFGFAPRRFLP